MGLIALGEGVVLGVAYWIAGVPSPVLLGVAVPLFSNPWIWAGVGLQLALQMAITYWPPMNIAFATAPIDVRAWVEIALIAGLSMLIIELFKRLQVGAR